MTLSPFAQIQAIFLFAAVILVPMTLRLIRFPDRNGNTTLVYRLCTRLYPLAGLSAVLSVCLPFSPWKWLSLVWGAFTLSLAVLGLQSAEKRATSRLEESVIHMGLLLSAIGGMWFCCSALSIRAFGYSEPMVILTAIHFHYTALLTLVLLGLLGRELSGSLFNIWMVSATCLLAGIPLVAIGIGGSRICELVGVSLLCSGVILFALLNLTNLSGKRLPTQLFKITASLSVVIGMYWAFRYGWTRPQVVDISQMVLRHGAWNAFGFVTPLSLAFTLEAPSPRLTPNAMPFSQLKGGRVIGKHFFSDRQILDSTRPPPTGLISDLSTFGRSDFDPSAVHPEVRAFYENTCDFSMNFRAVWQPGFRGLGALHGRWSRKAQQLNYPTDETEKVEEIDSQLLALDSTQDGRENILGWVRSYRYSGKAIYVAAYSTYRYEDTTYLNVAFPSHGGNMTSILKPYNGVGSELILSSISSPSYSGDEGIYLVRGAHTAKLLMNERIRVWSTSEGLAAQHDIWVLGFRFLELHYRMARSGQAVYSEAYEDRIL